MGLMCLESSGACGTREPRLLRIPCCSGGEHEKDFGSCAVWGLFGPPSAGAGLCPSFAFPPTHLLSLTGSVSLSSLSGSVSLDSYSGVCQSPFLDNRYLEGLGVPSLEGLNCGVLRDPLFPHILMICDAPLHSGNGVASSARITASLRAPGPAARPPPPPRPPRRPRRRARVTGCPTTSAVCSAGRRTRSWASSPPSPPSSTPT